MTSITCDAKPSYAGNEYEPRGDPTRRMSIVCMSNIRICEVRTMKNFDAFLKIRAYSSLCWNIVARL